MATQPGRDRSDDTALECTGIDRSFGGLRALKGVSLAIRPGEIFGLVGPNGSGKTTMVNVVTGFYPPQAGRVRLFGRDITGLAPYKIAQHALARTFQNLALFRGMSVLDNILLGRHVHMHPGALPALFYWWWAQREETAHMKGLFAQAAKAPFPHVSFQPPTSHGKESSMPRTEPSAALAMRRKASSSASTFSNKQILA